MQSFYDLQALADQRVEQRRAEADHERMITEARCSNTLIRGELSTPLVGRVLRLRSHVAHGLAPSFAKPAP